MDKTRHEHKWVIMGVGEMLKYTVSVELEHFRIRPISDVLSC